MRGKVDEHIHDELRLGITPAYAGKSIDKLGRLGGAQDHPRVCGEKSRQLS